MMDATSLTVLSAIVGFLLNMGAIAVAIYKLGRAVEKFEMIGKQQAEEIGELKDSVKIIAELITKEALVTQRQDTFAEMLNRFEARLEGFARGEGFILPVPYSKAPG